MYYVKLRGGACYRLTVERIYWMCWRRVRPMSTLLWLVGLGVGKRLCAATEIGSAMWWLPV